MRGCLSVLILAAGTVLAAAWFGGPTLAGVVIERSLDSAGFVAAERSVTVSSDTPLEILAGHADRVTIRATRATVRDLTASRLVLTLTSVDLVGGKFSGVDGQLDDVLIPSVDGSSVDARTVTVRGRAAAATATVRIDAGVLEGLFAKAIRRETGLSVAGLSLSAPDRIRFTAGLTISGRLAVGADGSLVIAATSGDTRFTVFKPNADLRLTSVAVSGTELVLTGATDLGSLIR
jgi:hypothetical protein